MKSIFDGWTKKIEGRGSDNAGGYCARGWLHRVSLAAGAMTVPVFPEEERIGKWIQKNMDPPAKYVHPAGAVMHPREEVWSAIIWANNTCALDIEGFKMVDLLTRGFCPEATTETAEPVLVERG